MYQEYIEKWKQYASQYGEQTCLFYMVGKFYELYDVLQKETGEGQTNVKQAVETLGITLTVRKEDGPKGEDCLFAGFPEQSLQKFAAILTREGWTVVVCDQTKDAAGKVKGRPVARIFSPGTHVELAGPDAPYLAGVWLQEVPEEAPRYAAAVLDLTTGQILSFESKASGSAEHWSCDELVHFFTVHPPRETVLWWRGSPLTKPADGTLRRLCGISKTALHVESGSPEAQATLEVPLVRREYLRGIFPHVQSLLPIEEALNLRTRPLTERCLVSLLLFAEDHLPSAIQNLHEHTTWTPETSVYMGNNSLTQLNYVSTGAEPSVLTLFGKPLTSLGKRALRERLLTPSASSEVIERNLQDVDYFVSLPEESLKRIESWLRLLHDIARLHRKILLYSVTAADLLALDTSYGCIRRVDELLKGTCLDFGEEARASFQAYLQRFQSEFDIEKAKQALQNEDLRFLPSEKAPKTAQAEQRLQDLTQRVEALLETIRTWVGLPPDALRLDRQDSSLYQFTGTKTTLKLVKEKLQRTPASTHPCPGMTVTERKSVRGSLEFPLVETFHTQAMLYRVQLDAALKEELPPRCRACEHSCWSSLESWVARVDVCLTLAKVAKERGYVRPEILTAPESGVYALGLRHPLLETVQTRVDYVKHDVSLGFDTESGWLLYGMNASGKSSLMKSIGISVLLAQAGSYVPASVFKLKPFQTILTRILNQDNLWAGLSSFAVEVSELRDIFQKANSQSLVLGDELCSGTESVSATSLVAASLKYLHGKGSRFVFATHYHDLNKLPEIASLPGLGIWHLRVHYDAGRDLLVYDRTLHRGPGGTLYGLEVARAMHLPHEILAQALVYRRTLLGETSLQEAKESSYNPLIVRKSCEVCERSLVRDLEVHHIVPREQAIQGRLKDGSSVNDIRNLIVVCQSCHDKHHAGEITIGKQVQTSSGPQRVSEHPQGKSDPTPRASRKMKVKWTEDEQAAIEGLLRKFPHLPLSRLVLDLKDQYDIEISVGALGKIRNSLT
jgi:DNA mismatch repair protein MutS